ncbi:asparaginase [Gracilibacillus oryzae]|uniref:Asparaginase n=1 Tax=Gracilibacillus oryzae TaxID=1672701 RepID=A0A7C8GSQ8_9BACI|nr:asparaginase [Gracilibacillus oryzae]KAB8134173.1 asparaginase [Gracilibacillus oryzae]
MDFPVIAKEFRNHTLENTHQGAICVIDQEKQIIYKKGDIQNPTYYRSAMKPLQAIPVFSSNVIEKYQLTGEEAALFTASQRGEQYHEQALLRLAEKLSLNENQLICNKSYPLNEQARMDYIKSNKEKRALIHNCAGKHLGFLAYAREKNFNSDYDELNHPIQQEILAVVSDLSETPADQVITGIDGCGVPVFAVSLYNMAVSYLKFANPESIQNATTRIAVEKIAKVMNSFPHIVASHHFICTTLLEDENIVAKGGAQGVYCLALKKEKISIALKVYSGTELLWPLLIAEILKKINYSNEQTIQRLYDLKSSTIKNDNGKEVGHIELCL